MLPPSKRDFSPASYLHISQDHLLTAALWLLLNDGREPSFENLVAEAFTSFPERFSLEGYPDWPNAHVVGKSWVRCRTDKKWMTGSAAEGFALTPVGEQVALRVLKRLGTKSGSGPVTKRGSRQTISSRVVLRIEGSEAYKKVQATGIAGVSEFDFCDLLYCTLESTPETVAKNYTAIKQQVEAFGRTDLLDFLEQLRSRFASRFLGARSRGGLMPKKGVE